jgi:hypothetical protein
VCVEIYQGYRPITSTKARHAASRKTTTSTRTGRIEPPDSTGTPLLKPQAGNDYHAGNRQGHDWVMGDALESSDAPVLHVKVLGAAPIEAVPGESRYYVRVMQIYRNMA